MFEIPPLREDNSLIQSQAFSFFKSSYVSSVKTSYPDNPNKLELFPYQNLFADLFQVYSKFLLMSEPGTGKSITFIEACERARKTGMIKDVYIFENNKVLENNIVREIYRTVILPFKDSERNERRESGPSEARERKGEEITLKTMKREIKPFYNISTYTKFYNKNHNLTDNNLRERYFNTIFIFDEVHRLIENIEENNNKNLQFFYRLFEKAMFNSQKLILVSATPVTAEERQILPYARLLNLSIPQNYNTSTIKQTFMGYISFVKAPLNPLVSHNYIGNKHTSPFNEYKLYYSEMKGIQAERYKYFEASSKRGTFDINLIQAAAFVFPDGSIGGTVKGKRDEEDEGFEGEESFFSLSSTAGKGIEKYVEDVSKEYDLPGTYQFKNNMFKTIDIPDISHLSAKYQAILDIEKEHINTPGTCFIYTGNMKNGGGAILLGLILEKYGGFSNYRRTKKLSNKSYVYINTEMSEKEKDDIIKEFNSPSNVTGNKIRIVIGTSQLKEGISFSHVVRIHLLNRPWTYAEDFQSTFRALRVVSHNSLIDYYKNKLNILKPNIKVNIYKHAAYYCGNKGDLGNIHSIDLKHEMKMVEKQSSLNKIITGLKEAAIDKLFFENEVKIKPILVEEIKEEKCPSNQGCWLYKDSFYRVMSKVLPIKKDYPLLPYDKNCVIEKEKNDLKYIKKQGKIYENSFLYKNSISIFGKFQQIFNNRNRLKRVGIAAALDSVSLALAWNFLFYEFLYSISHSNIFYNVNHFGHAITSKESRVDRNIIDDFYLTHQKKIKLFGIMIEDEFKIVDRRRKESNMGKNCYSYEKNELDKLYRDLTGNKESGKKEIEKKEYYCDKIKQYFKKNKLLVIDE